MNLRTMKLLSNTIGIEAMANPSALEITLTKIPMLVKGLSNAIRTSIAGPLLSFFDGKDANSFANRVQKVPYAQLRPLEVEVPQGLRSDLLSYAQTLQKAAEATATLNDKVLQPYTAWLGEKLGKPGSLTSVMGASSIRGYEAIDVDGLNDALSAHFDTHGRREYQVAYGKAILRNQDWFELQQIAGELTEIFDAKMHRAIIEATHEVEARLSLLVDRISKDADAYKVSGEVTKSLADLTYSVAAEVEFYGALRYRIDEFLTSMKRTIEIVEKKI